MIVTQATTPSDGVAMSERARSRTATATHLVAGPPGAATAGKLAAQTWVRARSLSTPALTPWHVEVTLGVDHAPPPVELDEARDSRLRIEIYSEEWGVFFCHQGRASWLRVTDVPFVHGRDDFKLLAMLPPLKDLRFLVRSLEKQHAIALRREHAVIRTNVPSAHPAVHAWVRSL